MISNTRRDTVRTSVITTVRDSLRLLKITHFALLAMIINTLKLMTLTNNSGSLSPIFQVSSPCRSQELYRKSTRGIVLTRRLPSQCSESSANVLSNLNRESDATLFEIYTRVCYEACRYNTQIYLFFNRSGLCLHPIYVSLFSTWILNLIFPGDASPDSVYHKT
jgi:hypothetical protein